MVAFRWICLFVYLPVSVLGGMFLSLVTEPAIRLDSPFPFEYVAAVVMPLVGLLGCWLIAPRAKFLVCLVYCLIGLALAHEYSPTFFPEGHPQAYAPTFSCFRLTVLTSVCYLILIGVAELRIRYMTQS